MKTVALYLGVCAVLICTGAVIDHHKDSLALVVLWAASFLIWVFAGCMLAVRGTFRWLRR